MDGVPIERIGPYGVRSASGKWRLLPSAFRWLVRHKAAYDVVCCVDYRGVGVAAIAARAVTGRRSCSRRRRRATCSTRRCWRGP